MLIPLLMNLGMFGATATAQGGGGWWYSTNDGANSASHRAKQEKLRRHVEGSYEHVMGTPVPEPAEAGLDFGAMVAEVMAIERATEFRTEALMSAEDDEEAILLLNS